MENASRANNAPDYDDNLAFEPKSADDLNKQGRGSDVLVSALEKLEEEVKQLKELLKECKSFVLFEVDVVRETSGKYSVEYKMISNILTRINAAIGESEE